MLIPRAVQGAQEMEDLRTEPRWPTQRAAPTRCSSAARSACAHGATAEGLFASAVVPEGIPPRAALARRTCGWSSAARWRCCSSSGLSTASGAGLAACVSLGATWRSITSSRLSWWPHGRRSLRRSCPVAAADLFATVDGYNRMVPHIFRGGLCDDEY